MSEQNLEMWGIALVDKVDAAIDNTMAQVAEEGELTLQGLITDPSRSTGRTWKRARYKRGIRREGGFDGREWTGDMRAAIKSRSGRAAPWTAVASFGWLQQFEEYYGLQEGGFDHPQTGEHIKGMFIMADGADIMFKRAEELLDKELYRV